MLSVNFISTEGRLFCHKEPNGRDAQKRVATGHWVTVFAVYLRCFRAVGCAARGVRIQCGFNPYTIVAMFFVFNGVRRYAVDRAEGRSTLRPYGKNDLNCVTPMVF